MGVYAITGASSGIGAKTKELLEKQGLYYAMYKSGFGGAVETTETLSTDY